MKMLCLQEEVSLVKSDQFQHVLLCGSLPSALKGRGNGGDAYSSSDIKFWF